MANIMGTAKLRSPRLMVASAAGTSFWCSDRANWLNSTVARDSTNTECGSTVISCAVFKAYRPGMDASTTAGSSPA